MSGKEGNCVTGDETAVDISQKIQVGDIDEETRRMFQREVGLLKHKLATEGKKIPADD